MVATVHGILKWAEKEGEVKAVSRIRLKLLADATREGIHMSRVDASTTASPHFISKLKSVASAVVGKPCPL